MFSEVVLDKVNREKELSLVEIMMYVDDYEYQEGSGDLDECNGRVTNGRYGYYVTSSYPWVMKCFKGTPDSSFQK